MLRRLSSMKVVLLCLAVGGALMLTTQNVSVGQAQRKDNRGHQLYMTYCASCHGVDAKGNGPAASALKTMPSDLTRIPIVEGKFPALRVKRIIGGDDIVLGHGSREMPVWGAVFRTKYDRTMATSNIYTLVKYLESIQEK